MGGGFSETRLSQRRELARWQVELPGMIEASPLSLQQVARLRDLAHTHIRCSHDGRKICHILNRIPGMWFEELPSELHDLRCVSLRDRCK